MSKVCPAHLSPCSPDSCQPHVKQNVILFVVPPLPGGDANGKLLENSTALHKEEEAMWPRNLLL